MKRRQRWNSVLEAFASPRTRRRRRAERESKRLERVLRADIGRRASLDSLYPNLLTRSEIDMYSTTPPRPQLSLPGPSHLLDIEDVPGVLRSHADVLDALRHARAEVDRVTDANTALVRELEQWRQVARSQIHELERAKGANKAEREQKIALFRGQIHHTDDVLVRHAAPAEGPMSNEKAR